MESQAPGWASLIERVARGLDRSGSRQWTASRKRESLQHVLDGSRSDPQRLLQRLQALMTAWETDAAPAAGEAPADAPTPEPAAPWPPLVASLQHTVQAALPGSESRARALADRLDRSAVAIAQQGATPALVAEVEGLCGQARQLFEHRHRLLEELQALCLELGAGMADLAEDESWARGQSQNLQARIAHDTKDGVNLRSVRAAATMLANMRIRQQRVKGERNAARDALKEMIQRMFAELAELSTHTGRFNDNIGRHAQAVEQAESLESLAGVVKSMVADGREVQTIVTQTQARLQAEHAKGSELEARVRSLESELRRLSDEATTDALTQVANRRGLAQSFDNECARMAREQASGATLAVALIDIDNFKKLNDTLGHAAGDVALKSLAAAVLERLRPSDHLARFGGEEFVLLLPNTGPPEAQEALTRLQRSLSASLFLHNNQEVFVTFSGGVTAWVAGETLESALARADEGLYEAKRSGKNRTCIA